MKHAPISGARIRNAARRPGKTVNTHRAALAGHDQILLREITGVEAPHVTNMGARIAEVYADGDTYLLREVAGQISLLPYTYIDAENRLMNADEGTEHLPHAVWHLIYQCWPAPPDKQELRAIQQARRQPRQPYLLHVLVGRRLMRKATETDAGEVRYFGVGFWRDALPVLDLATRQEEASHAPTHTDTLSERSGPAGSAAPGDARAEP